MKKRIAIILTLAILAFYPWSDVFSSNHQTLRVCVLKDAKELALTIKGRYKIVTLKTDEFLKEGKNLKKALVAPSTSGLLIGDEPFKIYGIKIVPKKGTLTYIGRRSFRGNLDIIRTEKKKLLVINHVDLEDYLKGVLYHEVSNWWPMETLKAQAIASRTYAVYQKSVNKSKDFDLTSDIYSQVYGGRTSERIKTNRAVNSTRGKVLKYNGKIFPTYYHATCSGHTEDASNLWDINLAPLRGVKCAFCRFSPHYRWRYKVPISDVEKKLNSAGYKMSGLKAIELQGRTSSGRVKELKIISAKEFIIPAKDFRLILGPNLVRSTNFRLRTKKRSFLFEGQGWGHGAGMCQWGAFFLGLRRYRVQHILEFYYPGARISKI